MSEKVKPSICTAERDAINGFAVEKCAYKNGETPLRIGAVLVARPPTYPQCIGCSYFQEADE